MGNILVGSVPGVIIGSQLSVKWPQGLLRGALGVVLIGAGVTIMNKANTDLVPWVVAGATVAVIALFAVQIALRREVEHDPERAARARRPSGSRSWRRSASASPCWPPSTTSARLSRLGKRASTETQYSAAVFEKVLIANRGEISIRVARTLKEMGIGSVAVYSEIERDAPHVRHADEAFLLGPATPAESYLNVEKILQVAQDAGAEAIHPGYGFLAENAPFAAAVEKAKLTWIGPPPKAIEAMGSKTEARQIMQKAGVPIVPGDTEPVKDVAAAKKKAKRDRLPDRGQSGRRRRRQGLSRGDGARASSRRPSRAPRARARSSSAIRPSTSSATSRTRATSRSRCSPMSKGNVIHLGERDCSIQRRHQKLIEESPGPKVDEEMRERIGKIATDAAAAVGYRSAGTVEGLQVGDDYFFLEMNTRVQVEHCVTEMVTGFDIVREQVRIAAGEKLSITPGGRRAPRPRDRVPDQRGGRPQELRSRPRDGSRPTASRRARASGSIPGSRRAPR